MWKKENFGNPIVIAKQVNLYRKNHQLLETVCGNHCEIRKNSLLNGLSYIIVKSFREYNCELYSNFFGFFGWLCIYSPVLFCQSKMKKVFWSTVEVLWRRYFKPFELISRQFNSIFIGANCRVLKKSPLHWFSTPLFA